MAANGDQIAPENGTANGANGTGPNEDDRKLFVGGLSWDTTENQIKDYFGKYGEIDNINLKTDPNTGKSRGFAFVVFKNSSSIDEAVNAGEHTLNNKKIDAKKAKAKQGKIFVGGLTAEITDDDIKDHFAQFGNVVQVELPFDKVKNQRKAFCFITYDSESVVNDILKNPKQTIKDKEVDVKKAAPKPDQGKSWGGGFTSPRGRGGRGGRGRGSYSNQNFNQGFNQGYGGYNQTYGGYDAYAYGGGYGGYNDYGNYDGGYQNQGNQRGGRGRSQQQRHQPY